MARRAILAAALVVTTAGAAAVAATDSGPASALPGTPEGVSAQVDPSGLAAPTAPASPAEAGSIVFPPEVDVPAAGFSDVGELVVPAGVPSPADVVRETGSWFSHGWTLDLRPDGTGTFGAWVGAFDGDRISLRLIPAPGEATVAEITAIETVGQGALAPGSRPGVGGLVTVAIGAEVRTAHVEWASGAERHSVDLCPAEGLDPAAMEALRCGA